MNTEKKLLKPIHGVITLLVFLFVLFVGNPLLQSRFDFGMWGLLVGELLFLAVALLAVLLFRGDFRRIFPMRALRLDSFFGTLLLWLATFGTAMILSLIAAYFFPEQMFGTSESISGGFTELPFLLSVLMIAVAPAICEEAVFRGVLLNAFWSEKRKWFIIAGTGIVFGICHGSIWRFLPTAILGGVMAYIVVETNNILYSVIMHFINNLVPLLVIQFTKSLSIGIGDGGGQGIAYGMDIRIPLMSVAVYLIIGAGIPFLFYIGNYLLVKGKRAYKMPLFGREKKHILYILVGISAAMVLVGIFLMILGFFVDIDLIKQSFTPF